METEQEEQRKEENLKYEINEFYSNVVSYGYLDVSYGYLDVRTAVNVFLDIGLSGEDLAEEVLRYAEETGTALKDIDVCYIAYEYILQNARNKIDEVLKFDFLNDIKGTGTEFYTYGNYMATNYDYSEETKEELQKVVSDATEEQKEELKEDKSTFWFLDSVGIEI